MHALIATAILSLLFPSIAPAHALAARTRALRPPVMVGTMPERNSVASLRPRHVLAPNLRFDRDEAVRFSTSGYAQSLGLARGSAAEAVNQDGDIVGSAGLSAFLARNGKTLILPKPAPYGRYSAIAYAVNAADEVVGDLFGPSGAVEPFVYTGGHAYALNSLLPPHSGWTIGDALGVNDHGEIVGDGFYNGTLYGVSLKPPQ